MTPSSGVKGPNVLESRADGREQPLEVICRVWSFYPRTFTGVSLEPAGFSPSMRSKGLCRMKSRAPVSAHADQQDHPRLATVELAQRRLNSGRPCETMRVKKAVCGPTVKAD